MTTKKPVLPKPEVVATIEPNEPASTEAAEVETPELPQPGSSEPQKSDTPWYWHPIYNYSKSKLLTMPKPKIPKLRFVAGYSQYRHYAKRLAAYRTKILLKSQCNQDCLPNENYLSLKDAAKNSGYSESRILEFASNGKIKLCIHAPDGIDLFPFDRETESTGTLGFLPPPEKLILDPEYCKQIKENHKTEQCDFKKVYISSFGMPKILLPGYANLRFTRASCVWRAFDQGNCRHIEIMQEKTQVAKDELQHFIRENPQAKSSTPPAFKDAMKKLLDEIVARSEKVGEAIDVFQLPGKTENLREVAEEFDANLKYDKVRTFNSYLNGLCGFKKKGGPQGKNAVNPFAKLFPEYYPSNKTHRIVK